MLAPESREFREHGYIFAAIAHWKMFEARFDPFFSSK